MVEKIKLWQPIIKSNSGNEVTYEAVLSDDSLDRDNELVGKSALIKAKESDVLVVGLMDHENKIMNQVCEWTNKRIEERDGHTAFIAEPKFFLSNPNAQILKGMLDEGANMGISIGAIVNDSEMQKIGDTEKKVYTDIEIIEASFVGVPANKHARITAIAKMFKSEEKKVVDKTYSEKEYTEQVSKVANLEKEKAELTKQLEELETVKEAKIELEKQIEDKESMIKEFKDEVEKLKSAPVLKSQHTQDPNLDKSKEAELLERKKEMEEKLTKGFIPVGRY